jgi:hypothetical protein
MKHNSLIDDETEIKKREGGGGAEIVKEIKLNSFGSYPSPQMLLLLKLCI